MSLFVFCGLRQYDKLHCIFSIKSRWVIMIDPKGRPGLYSKMALIIKLLNNNPRGSVYLSRRLIGTWRLIE